MTTAEQRLRDAIKAHENERYYNGNIPSWASELAYAASAYLASVNSPAPTLRDVFPESEWEVEEEIEGGQPNGIGEIEENYAREWFSQERETHHRLHYHVIGKWIDGPTYEEAQRRARDAAAKAERAAQLAAEKEANRPSEEDEILRRAEEILAQRAAADA